MQDFSIDDTVWHADTGKEWHIIKRASALDDEPPIIWKCERWESDKLIKDEFTEDKISKLKPPLTSYIPEAYLEDNHERKDRNESMFRT